MPVALPYNLDAISTDANRADGNFDSGCTYPAELLPTNLIRGGISFQLGPMNDGALNVVACQGQTLPLAAGYDQLCLLAAAATNDVTGPFTLNGLTTNLTVRYFSGFIGQWNPPSLKQDEVAWVCTHRHAGGGTNDAYRFCYLFKYSLTVPPGAGSITLPNAPGLRIFALSLATNSTAETKTAGGPLAAGNPPWANAGANQTASAGAGGTAAVTLDGSASQADGNIISYLWQENGVTLATASKPTVALAVGSHTILLTVTDDRGATAQDAVSVMVLSAPGNGVWITPHSSNWVNAANWSGGTIASGSGSTADFSTLALAANLTVSLDSSWTVGNLTFDDQAASQHVWTVTSEAGNLLVLDAGGSGPLITAVAPTILDVSLAGTNGLTKAGAGPLTFLGANTFSSGQVHVNGGNLTFGGGSSFSANNNFNVSNGVVNVNTTGQLEIASYMELGGLYNNPASAGSGVVNQTSGVANVGGSGTYLEVGGGGSGAFGSYNLAGGNLNTVNSSGLRVGASGIGIFNQTGGALNCARYFAIGSGTAGNAAGGGRGMATFSGGTAVLGSANYRVILGDKTSSTAVLNLGTQAGGNATVVAVSTSSGNWGIELLDVSGATMNAVLNLNRGTLQTIGPIWRNAANATGTAVLNFNGGCLQAGAGQANFITNALTAVNVYQGGAIIDTQGYNVTNAAPLLAAPGKGIYPAGGTLAVANGGSGYLSAPWVALSGGAGSNALAVASLSGGTIASVTMTCPGQNYQAGNAVNFIFTGGGATNPAGSFTYSLQAGDLATNAIGGLTKLGAGSLTLSASQTFGGNAVVSNGTLNLTGRLLGGGMVFVNGGTLSGNGAINGPVTINSGGTLAPGSGRIGTLAISNRLTFLPGATCAVEVNKTLATNDLVQGVTQLTFAGTLVVSNLGGTLAAMDSFRLFSAKNYAGDFSAILPATPGGGLAWNTRQLKVSGTLAVVAVNTNAPGLSANVTNSTLNLSWPMDRVGWRLQTQTNELNQGLGTNWADLADARNTNREIMALNPSQGGTFFRLIYP